jgi:hypothetical protein
MPRAQEDIRLSDLPDDSHDDKSFYAVIHDYPSIAFMIRQVQLKGGASIFEGRPVVIEPDLRDTYRTC